MHLHADEGAQHGRDHGQRQQPVSVAQDLVADLLHAPRQVKGALHVLIHSASVLSIQVTALLKDSMRAGICQKSSLRFH
ncbi:hypothetical protein D3C72_2144890 [compost metagenome]